MGKIIKLALHGSNVLVAQVNKLEPKSESVSVHTLALKKTSYTQLITNSPPDFSK